MSFFEAFWVSNFCDFLLGLHPKTRFFCFFYALRVVVVVAKTAIVVRGIIIFGKNSERFDGISQNVAPQQVDIFSAKCHL